MRPANRRLTNQRIASALKLGKKAWLCDDIGLRGWGRLVARISNGVSALLYYRYSVDGHYCSIPLGPHSEHEQPGYLTLTQARDRVVELSALYRNPATRDVRTAPPTFCREVPEDSTPSAQSEVGQSPTDPESSRASLLALCELYVAQLKADSKMSWRDNGATIKRELQPQVLAKKAATSITPSDIVQILRGLVERSPYMAQRLQGIIHAAYEAAMKNRFKLQRLPGWDEFVLDVNPARSVGKIDAKSTRDRALNGRDLGLLWLHLNAAPARASIAYRLLRLDLLLGGQRCQQLVRIKLDHVDEFARTITLLDGKGRRKKPRNHVLPLSDLAWKEVSELISIAHACDSEFLFVGRTQSVACHPQTISNVTSEISKLLASVTFGDRNVAPFIYLDLRRTTESRMGEIGISREMKQQLLSHGLSGVQETHYDRYAYVPQKSDALRVWQEYLLSMAEAQRSTYLQAFSIRGFAKTKRNASHLSPCQPDDTVVRFWVDTEFTGFDQPDLLSVGLVAENGVSECYVELLDAERECHCSDFVRKEVLPLFGLLGVRATSYAELSDYISSFLQATAPGCNIELMYDSKMDKDLLSNALEEAPQWDDLQEHIAWRDVSAQVNESDASAAAKRSAFDAAALEGVGRHHALIDARALRAAYLVVANERRQVS